MSAMLTAQRARPTGRSVLLYSGGMDSVCFDRLLRPDVLLHVPSDAAYTAQETRCLDALAGLGFITPRRLVRLPGVLNLSRWERDDAIVPNRNAHLVLLAANYGERIWLGSVSGDRSADKDPGFYERMTALLDHMHQPQHWTEGRCFAVGSPYKDVTKTQLVADFLAAGGDADALLISYSCYRGHAAHCGVCKPCARKRVALENNGVVAPPGYWEDDFWNTPWFPTLMPSIMSGSYRGAEDADWMRFLQARQIT